MNALPLVPLPRQASWHDQSLRLPEQIWVAVLSRHDQLLPTLRRFQAAARAAGIETRLTASAAGLAGVPHVVVDPQSGAVAQAQGYALTVDPMRITIAAADPPGAAYGLATLAQLLALAQGPEGGREVPCCEIRDWPDFPRRGVMLDISRGKVPTMDNLFRFVDLLADLKINEFQLYTEHTFAYREHREVWQAYSPMTGEEIMAVDQYCRERFIDLVPNQNSFGHMTQWLIHPRYRHMAEAPEGFDLPWGGRRSEPFSLSPAEPSVIPFLAGLYDELLPHFTSRYFNVGCDETFDLGQGRSREAVAERGEHAVYLEQLLKIHRLVTERGRTMQFWGDIIIKYPAAVAQLPKDVIALEWGYEADHPFAEHCAEYGRAGIAFYVCPGTSTWMSLVGRTDNALANMRSAAEHGLRHGAVGFLNTVWGDYGHQDYEPVTYLPLAYGAAVSWAFEANRDADVRPFLNRVVFRDRAGQIAGVLYDLGNTYLAAGPRLHNASVLGRLFHSAATWREWPVLLDCDFDAQEEAVRRAAGGLDRVDLRCDRGHLILQELRNSVRLLLLLCDLGRTLQGVRQGAPPAPGAADRLIQELEAVACEHRELWLQRSRPGGLEEMSMKPFRAWQAELRRL